MTLRSLELPASFPVESEYYTIASVERIQGDPGFLKFLVRSPHADYEVEGLLPLKKLLHEVEVIEQIKHDDMGSGFVDGAVDSVKATGEGFVTLVSHPIDSAKGIGQAAGKLGRKMGGIFRRKEEGEKTTWNETLLGSSERELANKFGVDIYTTNPYMKELLTQMARARMGGKGAAMAAKFLLPVAGLVSATLTASGINSTADQIVNDKSRGDLFKLNEEALDALGFSRKEISDLLNISYYSPRESTYLRFYLEQLRDVKGCRDIMKKAAAASSALEARKILYEAQMAVEAAAGKANASSKFERLEVFDEGLALEGADRILFMTPYDYLDGPAGAKALERAASVQSRLHKSDLEIRNAGKAAAEFAASALLRGAKTRSWLLF